MILFQEGNSFCMTSIVPRTKTENVSVHCPATTAPKDGKTVLPASDWNVGTSVSRLVTSQGNPRNRNNGNFESGGPFFVTHEGYFVETGSASAICTENRDQLYTGPFYGAYNSKPSGIQQHHEATAKSFDEKSLDPDGATAISQVAPTNPSANLGTTLAESVREGIPSFPGIQSWKSRAGRLRDAGSEYLNYQFGWAPLVSEIHSVVSAARNHRDILQNYRHNEGKNVHRRFDFDTEHTEYEEELGPSSPNGGRPNGNIWFPIASEAHPESQRVNRVSFERKRWFEGCFTYGGPSGTDSFRRALGYGSEADAVYGLNLTPSLLWELTPWSWAVDWFSNTGDLITNISNFAVAGLVMRYGYMMEETISESYTYYGPHWRFCLDSKGGLAYKKVGSTRTGLRTVRKCRAAANPFGFGVGWEGLSPTQLAITAAIGITRLL